MLLEGLRHRWDSHVYRQSGLPWLSSIGDLPDSVVVFQLALVKTELEGPCRWLAALQGLSGIGIPNRKPRHVTLAHYVSIDLVL